MCLPTWGPTRVRGRIAWSDSWGNEAGRHSGLVRWGGGRGHSLTRFTYSTVQYLEDLTTDAGFRLLPFPPPPTHAAGISQAALVRACLCPFSAATLGRTVYILKGGSLPVWPDAAPRLRRHCAGFKSRIPACLPAGPLRRHFGPGAADRTRRTTPPPPRPPYAVGPRTGGLGGTQETLCMHGAGAGAGTQHDEDSAPPSGGGLRACVRDPAAVARSGQQNGLAWASGKKAEGGVSVVGDGASAQKRTDALLSFSLSLLLPVRSAATFNNAPPFIRPSGLPSFFLCLCVCLRACVRACGCCCLLSCPLGRTARGRGGARGFNLRQGDLCKEPPSKTIGRSGERVSTPLSPSPLLPFACSICTVCAGPSFLLFFSSLIIAPPAFLSLSLSS